MVSAPIEEGGPDGNIILNIPLTWAEPTAEGQKTSFSYMRSAPGTADFSVPEATITIIETDF